MTEFVTPHLRTVLKTYQDSATKSLQGPGSSLPVHPASMKKELLTPDIVEEPIIAPPPAPPEIPHPVLSAADTGRSILYETFLEGKPIGCFMLGGEMRLCFPQVLNNVLMDFGLDQINRTFDDLRIFCSQCTLEQLNQFKAAKILPEDVNSSGLITRTNAERLCSALLHRAERTRIAKGGISFKVYHRCFGKCEGICTPDLYSYKDPACIRCIECNGMFSPQKFVCHVHQQQENSTLHWGFDSNNWRYYLHVSLDEENREKYTTYLDDLRDREQHDLMMSIGVQRDSNHLKRKSDIEESIIRQPCKTEPLDIPQKKAKILDEKYLLDYQYQAFLLSQYRHPQYNGFRPWALVPPPTHIAPKHIPHLPYTVSIPYLSQEPPVLQNPERVVRISECERYEQSYQPNVALAPRKASNYTNGHAKSTGANGRDRDCEKDKDADVEDEPDERAHVISMNIQIKKERPTTPTDESTSPDPRLQSSTLPPLPPASSTINPAPISPEGQSGSSNEITSSTSPVPVTKLHKPTESTADHSSKMSPPLSDSHHIHHALHRSHQQTIKPIGSHHQDQHTIGNHALTNGVLHKHTSTGGHMHNPEFELSTDTDDDSTAGEADSSNNLAPLDVAIEALKDTRTKDRERVLHVIKMLLNENIQLGVRNEKLLQELQNKEDEIAELMEYKSRCDHDLSTISVTNSNSIGVRPINDASINANNDDAAVPIVNGDITGSIPDITELENRTITIGGKNETEVIRMPLKKSMRRSPEDTVVIMQAHKVRDDSLDMHDKVSRSGYVEREDTPPLHNGVMVTTADAVNTA